MNNFSNYMEVNGIKQLFNDTETKLAYQQFINDLNDFFEYDIMEQ